MSFQVLIHSKVTDMKLIINGSESYVFEMLIFSHPLQDMDNNVDLTVRGKNT